MAPADRKILSSMMSYAYTELLRVVDVSIMSSANVNAGTLMIAEKAADMTMESTR